MSKTNTMNDLPPGYFLNDDEEFRDAPPEAEVPENYFVGADEPDEQELNATFTPLKTLWFDIPNNIVKVFTGKSPSGVNAWTESENQLKLVVDFESQDLVGMITKKAGAQVVPDKLTVIVPPISFEDLMEEI